MINFTAVFLPILFGLLFVMVFYWAVVFWQIERTRKVFCLFMVFAGFCFLYWASIRHISIGWVTAGRTVVLLALFFALWYGFTDVFIFMREKKAKSVAAVPPVEAEPKPAHSMLRELAESGEPVSLIATPTQTSAKEDITLEATQE